MFEVVFFRTKTGKQQQHQSEELFLVGGLEAGLSGCQSYIYMCVCVYIYIYLLGSVGSNCRVDQNFLQGVDGMWL